MRQNTSVQKSLDEFPSLHDATIEATLFSLARAGMAPNVEFTRGFGLARLRGKTKSGRSGSRSAGKMHIILALPGAIFAAQTRAREELRHRSERSV